MGNEWMVNWMKNCFKYATLDEHWKETQSENWFDPSFPTFINKELVPAANDSKS
jgi:hypothetical protein